jgi:hydroxyacylglutathione hydrolase
VVDPSDAGPVLDAAKKLGWTLSQVICTHYHADHTDGNLEIKAATGATVIGPGSAEKGRIPGLDVDVSHGDTSDFAGVSASVIGTKGHTTGHVAYHVAEQGAVFVGDTLFVLGCGRLFEGTAVDMWASLQRLAALPDDTLVYCGHEYTLGEKRAMPCMPQLHTTISPILS